MGVEKKTTAHATFHFPILHLDVSIKEQEMKVIEEMNELKKEVLMNGTDERIMHEVQDVIQAMLTLLSIKLRSTALDERETDERIQHYIEQENQAHRKKLATYAAERGW